MTGVQTCALPIYKLLLKRIQGGRAFERLLNEIILKYNNVELNVPQSIPAPSRNSINKKQTKKEKHLSIELMRKEIRNKEIADMNKRREISKAFKPTQLKRIILL